jgi:hypothetical protein
MDFEPEIRALARRNGSTTNSGVMSHCGPPSSSNPTINSESSPNAKEDKSGHETATQDVDPIAWRGMQSHRVREWRIEDLIVGRCNG